MFHYLRDTKAQRLKNFRHSTTIEFDAEQTNE